MPEELHFQKSNRIGPIVAIADEGYVINTQNQTLTGNHGFDNSIESMRAIFLAKGPNFKKNVQITGLKNVDVYPLLCDLIKIECHSHNGSMIPFENALAPTTPSIVTTTKTNSANSIAFNNLILAFLCLSIFYLL